MTRQLYGALLFIFVLLASGRQALAVNLFYLCVGNSHYRVVSRPGVHPFPEIRGGNRSARRVAEALDQNGAQGGILFRSEASRFVTRGQVLAALKEIIARAKKQPEPFIFYYFMGHGVSEGIGWNHFSVPGDFVGAHQGISAINLSERMLYTGEIFDLLQASHMPFLMMLDNCYEGSPVTLTSNIFSESLKSNLADSFRVLRFLNEFHEPDPVLYSTSPGTSVSVTVDPLAPASGLGIGPLARRFLLIIENARSRRMSITINELVKQMTDPSLDNKTRPAVCFAEVNVPSVLICPSRVGTIHRAEERIGNGSPREALSGSASTILKERTVTGTAGSSFRFKSEAGEWIGGDQRRDYSGMADVYQMICPVHV